jgi:hypothetical protein
MAGTHAGFFFCATSAKGLDIPPVFGVAAASLAYAFARPPVYLPLRACR